MKINNSLLGAMLHSSLTANIHENPLSGRKLARVLVIYTGGTIGMKNNENGGGFKRISYWFF